MKTTAVLIPSAKNDEIPANNGDISISHTVLSLMSQQVAQMYSAIPCAFDSKGRLEVLMTCVEDYQSIQILQMYTGKIIRPRLIHKDEIKKLIIDHYGSRLEDNYPTNEQKKVERRLTFNPAETTVVIVNDIIHEAIRLRASDIHLEPFELEMAIRFRVDGVLQEITTIPKNRIAEVISRIKILSRMDIAEKRRSQDGRIRINEDGRNVDIRASTLPTDFGEKMVLRLLDKSSFDYSIDSIGLEPNRLALFKKAVQQPNGIVLLTGPTGSGKTTTLYGIINYIRRPGINISTVEDPIEYNITSVNQTQVNPVTGMTFAHSLRTLLRQDPDVIMVGEMRDQETAEISIRASLTGHLVLSTLHTNDAPSAASRLIDMGIEPYLVSSSVTMFVAQRLVRKICSHCKCEANVSIEIKKSFGLSADIPLFKGLGCSACGYTGYKGRTGIFEILPVSDHIRSLINRKAYAAEIRTAALDEGMVTLREHALSKLTDGLTTIEEVLREVAVVV
jgi:type IV pilus assembly protein PilB